jgi:hypothetical protein
MADFIAASSVFHRSSWKFDQETPITLPLASAERASENDNMAAAKSGATAHAAVPKKARGGNFTPVLQT